LADFNNFWQATSRKKLDASNFSFGQFILMLSLQYFVKCRSRSFSVYDNEFILYTAGVGSEMIN